MVVLESCPKHNMVAYLEKTDGNAKFHEIIDFLARSSIHNALTLATVSISEASIRSDLLFDDADGIDSLPNQAIFDAIQLMGHLDAKKIFVMYPRFISMFLDKQLMNVPVPLGKVTPLFASMLVQPTEDEGATSERPSEPQPIPFPPHPKSSGGNHGGQSSSDKSLSGNEGDMTLQSVYDLCISLCTRIQSQPLIKTLEGTDQEASEENQTCYYTSQSLDEECILEAKIDRKEILEDKLDAKGVYTKDAQDVGRTRDVVNEEKETADDKVSTKDALSTAKKNEGTDDRTEGRSATPTTPTTTPTMFGDDETIAQVLLNMSQAKAVSREKEKGVELKDVEETGRPGPTSTRSLLTLKPLPKIDPKDKGKKKIEEEDESDTESKGIPEAEKKFKQLARDEEIS
ncbi:hypothetical protein Tco_1355112 [Tanacetum coccineum]